ncbi:hypothetical protein Pmani_025699 [Petrolisthes manimaculis]|uniref:Uncharacterized protein n=1 Tax=Petrolisthes manimaculis TaxID=1843537 RepID=A0AAE1P7G4_9EUCA|nr:hypothetical protein Pmani_025699 [Petrolisthes manimaculis]
MKGSSGGRMEGVAVDGGSGGVSGGMMWMDDEGIEEGNGWRQDKGLRVMGRWKGMCRVLMKGTGGNKMRGIYHSPPQYIPSLPGPPQFKMSLILTFKPRADKTPPFSTNTTPADCLPRGLFGVSLC